jgi:hypothetical protein
VIGGESQALLGGGHVSDNAARRPRWPTFVLVAVLLALFALFVPVFRQTPSATVRARFEQIQVGMTEDQVEELLGPRGTHDRSRSHTTMTSAVGTGPGSSHHSWWYFPGCDVEVGFDEDGRVYRKRIDPSPAQSVFDKAVRLCKQTLPSPSP